MTSSAEAVFLGDVREQVARPGRATYQARRSLAVVVLESNGTCVLVTRTHDVDLAAALAAYELSFYTDVPLPHAKVGWFRRVPWDVLNIGVDYTWIDAKPGDRSATPGVIFYRAD